MSEDTIITAEMLTSCGPLEAALFRCRYPEGLPLREMRNHEEGWIRRAAARVTAEAKT